MTPKLGVRSAKFSLVYDRQVIAINALRLTSDDEFWWMWEAFVCTFLPIFQRKRTIFLEGKQNTSFASVLEGVNVESGNQDHVRSHYISAGQFGTHANIRAFPS